MLPKVLIIYTGGTFGMDIGSNERAPLALPRLSPKMLGKRLRDRVPELERIARCDIEILMNRDSAHVGPDEWLLFAERIKAKWKKYDGIVLLHGTDTLCFTASALSFLLRPCLKPVVITGAQRPLSALRTDARRNLISAVEIVAHGPRSVVNQVSVFFDDRLMQGNRTRKRSASEFAAFESPRARPLAMVGTQIRYLRDDTSRGHRKSAGGGRLVPAFNRNIALMHVTPGFPSERVADGLLPNLDGLVLVIFPSGTAPTHDKAFIEMLRMAREEGMPVILVSEGASETSGNPGHYAAGAPLLAEGCLWAGEMTPECAFVKASLLLGQPDGKVGFRKRWAKELADEGLVKGRVSGDGKR